MGYLTETAEPIALAHANVLDLTSGLWLANRNVYIRRGRIEAIEQSDVVRNAVRVVDCAGKYVIPGFIDTHIHWEDWMGEIMLLSGVTTALDPGSMFPLAWMQAQKEGTSDGRIFGPRLLIAGALFHGADTKEKRNDLFAPWHPLITKPGEATEAAIHFADDEHVDCLKAYNFLSVESIGELATVARERRIPSLGHISVSAVEAAKQGLRGIAHGCGLIESVVPRSILDRADQLALQTIRTTRPSYPIWFTKADDAMIDDAIDVLVEQGMFIEPDMIHSPARGGGKRVAEYEVEDSEFLSNPALDYIPLAHRAEILGFRRIGDWLTATPDELRLAEEGMDRLFGIYAEFHRRGGKLLVASGLGHVIPGNSIHRELQLMVDIGLSALEALRGATSRAAEFLYLSDDVGTVEVGKRADLLVLDRDPLEDIRNSRSISQVVQHGRLVEMVYHPWHQNPIPQPPAEFTMGRFSPRISHLNPPAVPFDRASTLEVIGTSFDANSVVEVEGRRVPTTFVSAGELRAQLNGRWVPGPGLYEVRVRRPQPMELPALSEPAYLVVPFGPASAADDDSTRSVS